MGYPSDQLYEEVAYIAMHFNWPMAEVLALDHGDRRHWVTVIQQAKQQMGQG